MKAPVLLALGLAVGAATAAEPDQTINEDWPKSVDEAVQRLRNRLSPEDLEWIRRNPKDVVTSQLHLPYGTGVRNDFGLWGKNKPLLASCRTSHAEECSSIIFSAMWDKVRAETDPLLAENLDCHFSALTRTKIDTTGWYRMRLGEMLTDLQRQIDQQADTSNHSSCGALKIDVLGSPDLQCFVRVEYEDTGTLEHLFQWVSFRNAFSVTHDPPYANLTFTQECPWPEQPKHFAPQNRKEG